MPRNPGPRRDCLCRPEEAAIETQRSADKRKDLQDRFPHCVRCFWANLRCQYPYRRGQNLQSKWLAVYDEPIPVEVLVQYISDVKQNYTHHGGLRPYGVSFLFGGWDAHLGFQLYQTDPSGNYSAWVATSIGGSAPEIASALKQNIADSSQKILLKEAQQYAVSALIKTTDITKVSSDKMEILTVVKGESGDILAKYVSNAEVDAICRQLQDK